MAGKKHFIKSLALQDSHAGGHTTGHMTCDICTADEGQQDFYHTMLMSAGASDRVMVIG